MEKKFQDKRMNIMVNKIGLPELVAEWCVNKSKKYAIWIANQIRNNNMVRAFHRSKSGEEKLINFNSDIDTILDWKKEVQDINLNEHNFETALRKAKKFHKDLFVPNLNGLKNTNVVLDCGEYKWVQLITVQDCKEEGKMMGHCIGGNGHNTRISTGGSVAFSLRDKYNKPHLTLEAHSDNKSIFEFKGNSNSVPKTEYLDYFVKLNEKYNFSQITDHTVRSFENNIEAVEQITNANENFFSFDFKLKLGFLPFSSGESYVDTLNITTQKTIEIPDNVSFYSSISIATTEGVTLGENLLVGGNLTLQVAPSNLTIKDNIGVGGNLFLGGNLLKHKDINKISYFGEKSEIYS
mgnify:FL=1|tara:strand:- start:7912 stop:8964 length:1053 start_codon:yes stop_codon:yes gene_type:complete